MKQKYVLCYNGFDKKWGHLEEVMIYNLTNKTLQYLVLASSFMKPSDEWITLGLHWYNERQLRENFTVLDVWEE